MKQAALLGCGVVGAGVASLMEQNAPLLAKRLGEPLNLKYILELRDCSGKPWADKVVKDFAVIESDPEIAVAAECIGGAGVAYEFVKRCLLAGKSVVTSNKQLIAEKGRELLSIAREKGVFLLFEASVGGGIPLLGPLTNSLAANRMQKIYGIVNGTTNYILTEMLEKGRSFDEALQEAQRLGYAEADPSADVDGIDAQRKLCILADLSYGSELPPARVPAEGIRGVTARDAAFGDRLGYAVKLLAYTEALEGDRFTAFVAPHLVKRGTPLSAVGGVMNAVSVWGDAVGECLFYGAGAGSVPTASAVVGDMLEVLSREGQGSYLSWGPERPERFVDPDTVPCRWYVRYQNGCANHLMEQCLSEDGECAGITAEALTREKLREKMGGSEILSCFRVLA